MTKTEREAMSEKLEAHRRSITQIMGDLPETNDREHHAGIALRKAINQLEEAAGTLIDDEIYDHTGTLRKDV